MSQLLRSLPVLLLASPVIGLLVAAAPAVQTPRAPDPASFTCDDSGIARWELLRGAPAPLANCAANPMTAVPTRIRATTGLARLEHIQATAPLLALVKDPDERIRQAAIFGLGQLDAALDRNRPVHRDLALNIEETLVKALKSEPAFTTQRALIRALGRIAVSPGLDALIAKAQNTQSPQDIDLAAESLQALGVAGARRQASRSTDSVLAIAVEQASLSKHSKLRRAAAYAAFRQQLALSESAIQNLRVDSDAETRIWLTRSLGALAKKNDTGAALALEQATVLLKDGDWRVRVEAMRFLKQRGAQGKPIPVDAIQAASQRAFEQLQRTPWSGERHVLWTGCEVLGGQGIVLEDARWALSDLLQKIKKKMTDDKSEKADAMWGSLSCQCAASLDGINAKISQINTCRTKTSYGQQRWAITAISRMPISSSERVEQMAVYLESSMVLVRMDAANALAAEGSPEAIKIAVQHLPTESDSGVAGTLLDFLSEAAPEQITDDTMNLLANYFYSKTNYEDVYPLFTLGKLAKDRNSSIAIGVQMRLSQHENIHVRDAVEKATFGERAFGARSIGINPPNTGLPKAMILKTTAGDVRISLLRTEAPIAVSNFVQLAARGFYRGTPWHRVIADFVAQGGDRRGDGTGGPGYTIPCENSDETYRRGAVGMALSGKDTGGSQFFLTHSAQPHLDGRYTVFGFVEDGAEVMDALLPDDVLHDVIAVYE